MLTEIFFLNNVHISIVIVLTVLTQIGGVALLLSLLISRKWKSTIRNKSVLTFLVVYSALSLLVVPNLARYFGRVKISNSENISPVNYAYVLMNRNYVVPELHEVLVRTSSLLRKDGIKVKYLDANFPFINSFPLLPHLSHNDGKKIDLLFVYTDVNGKVTNRCKSLSGYGIYTNFKMDEVTSIPIWKINEFLETNYPRGRAIGVFRWFHVDLKVKNRNSLMFS